MTDFIKKEKLCLGISKTFDAPFDEQIRLIKKVGFDAFFTSWDENLKKYKEIADEIGLIYQSVHAPFKNAAKMWKSDSESKEATEELIKCVKDSREINVPIVVIHPYIGFEDKYEPTKYGIENFGVVIEEAKKQNIKIAFENVEGEEYLEALMNAFSDYENVGFCWDSGHELCYNKGKDMLKLYGKKLIATHLNDNCGISDCNGKIYWTDDLHLLPFDGIHNWEDVANRLNNCNYVDILTFELSKTSKPNRNENDKYSIMSLEEYLKETYFRACKIASLKNQS